MANILIIDDGTESRMSKTRMYRMAVANGNNITSARLNDLTEVKGYDLIVTDLDGTSAADNNKFLDLLRSSGEHPKVLMFSGRFTGAEDDLPAGCAKPANVSTHNDTEAFKVISAAVADKSSGKQR